MRGNTPMRPFLLFLLCIIWIGADHGNDNNKNNDDDNDDNNNDNTNIDNNIDNDNDNDNDRDSHKCSLGTGDPASCAGALDNVNIEQKWKIWACEWLDRGDSEKVQAFMIEQGYDTYTVEAVLSGRVCVERPRVKPHMNDEWIDWACTTLSAGNREHTETVLIQENYNKPLIDAIMTGSRCADMLRRNAEDKTAIKREDATDSNAATTDDDTVDNTIDEFWTNWACEWLDRGDQAKVEAFLNERQYDLSSVRGILSGELCANRATKKKYITEEWVDWACDNMDLSDKVETALIRQNYENYLIDNIITGTRCAKRKRKKQGSSADALSDEECEEVAEEHNRFVLDKLGELELSENETKLLDAIERIRDSGLLDRVKKQRIIVEENFLPGDVAEWLYSFFVTKKFHKIKGSKKKKLNFTFQNIDVDQDTNRASFIFNRLFPGHAVFHGGLGFATYGKGAYIAEHSDHGGYKVEDTKYFRSVSMVLYFAKGWQESYGGGFHDMENDQVHLPSFNKAVFFSVPFDHEVLPVIEDKGRFSVFAFFAVPKYLFYLPEERFVITRNFIN